MKDDLDREIKQALARLVARTSREAPSRLEQELVGRVRRRRAQSLAATVLAIGLCVALLPAIGTLVGSWRSQDGKSLPPAGSGDRSTPTSSPSSESPPATATHTCSFRLVGDGGVAGDGEGHIPSDWRSNSVMAGPLGLYKLRSFAQLPAERFQPAEGTSDHYDGIAFYAILEAGNTVTISIPEGARNRLAILADPSAGGPPYRLSTGVHSLTLEACPDRDTEFLEGFLVAGAHCAPVAVLPESGDSQVVQLSFGAGSC